jgi:hypothetical protein
MCREAISVPDGLLTGPIFVNGEKMPNTGEAGPALNIYPGADGVQHCEIAGMRDTLDGYAATLPKWAWLQRFIAIQNWETKVRTIDGHAKVHAAVRTRFDLPKVTQCARIGAYRPDALALHEEFKHYYSSPNPEGETTPSGPTTSPDS